MNRYNRIDVELGLFISTYIPKITSISLFSILIH